MTTMRKLLLLLILATFCSNCQTQPGVLSLSGGAIAPVGNNPGIDRTTSSSEPTSGSEATPSPRAPISGTVVDAQSQKPILAATVFHNGVLLQNNFALKGITRYIGIPYYKAHGESPIKLQSHGDPSEPISFRNIWIRPLN